LAVIVPVKSAGKSRLSPILSAEERRALSESLFKGIMGTLSKSNLLAACHVVSSDPGVLGLASSLGVRTVREERDLGVNEAVRSGMMDAKESSEFLVLPSDLPLLGTADVNEVLRLREAGIRAVVSPSAAFDGTNALLFPRRPRFPLSFDNSSFWNHLAGASRLGLPVGICARKGIMFDVDTPEDLRRLARSGVKSESASLALEAFE
jgi:2-phospho-L-lactate guanylyltransferase